MPKSRTIFLIAGEPSGDGRGAELVRALKKEKPHLSFEGLGGPKMKEAGVKLLDDLTSLSAIGFGDVLRKYFQIREIFYKALKYVNDLKPSCIVLIDYPGFNLRFAKKINKKFPVLYYVSPQIWAWGKRRIHTIRRVVHHMMVLFRFEESMYREAGIPVTWVGHPIVEPESTHKSKSEIKKEFQFSEDEKIISLLPGSREAEVRRILPIALETASILSPKLPKVSFLLSESSNVPEDLYNSILDRFQGKIRIHRARDRMHDILTVSDFAIVASGTATLETALSLTPFVILYKAAWSTYFLGKRLIRIPFIGMVNIIGGKKIISEYIQENAVPEKIVAEVLRILKDEVLRSNMLRELARVKEKLGPPGASQRAAETILKILSEH